MKGGFVISPFNPRLQTNELEYLINYSEINTLFVGREFTEMVSVLRPRFPKVRNYILLEINASGMTAHHGLIEAHSEEEPDVWVKEEDAFLIIYTSGTTGTPVAPFILIAEILKIPGRRRSRSVRKQGTNTS
jgi:acyl-coenzyme A synthetase/AMP-(fatty) acid ligase